MNEPKNYALIEDKVVFNIISLCDSNASDFPTAVCVEGKPVAVGDIYSDGVFYHEGVAV